MYNNLGDSGLVGNSKLCAKSLFKHEPRTSRSAVVRICITERNKTKKIRYPNVALRHVYNIQHLIHTIVFSLA